MDEILGEYPILKRLEGKPVNIDELDYLAKRLDSFCYAQEGAQFQGAAVSYLLCQRSHGCCFQII